MRPGSSVFRRLSKAALQLGRHKRVLAEMPSLRQHPELLEDCNTGIPFGHHTRKAGWFAMTVLFSLMLIDLTQQAGKVVFAEMPS